MIRSFFFALGTFIGLSGMSLFVVDGVVLNQSMFAGDVAKQTQTGSLSVEDVRDSLFDPPEWVSYTLIGMGGLTMLYSVALPRSS